MVDIQNCHKGKYGCENSNIPIPNSNFQHHLFFNLNAALIEETPLNKSHNPIKTEKITTAFAGCLSKINPTTISKTPPAR